MTIAMFCYVFIIPQVLLSLRLFFCSKNFIIWTVYAICTSQILSCLKFTFFFSTFVFVQMKDLMILLEVHIMWHLKSSIDLIAWKQLSRVLLLLHIFCYVEADHSGQGQNLEFSGQC
jgi:hypothetical protein